MEKGWNRCEERSKVLLCFECFKTTLSQRNAFPLFHFSEDIGECSLRIGLRHLFCYKLQGITAGGRHPPLLMQELC